MYCSWGGLRFYGYKLWELLGDGVMVYIDIDLYGFVRKIVIDLLSYWFYIFIVFGKGRFVY